MPKAEDGHFRWVAGPLVAIALLSGGPRFEAQAQGYGWRPNERQIERRTERATDAPVELELQAAIDSLDRIEAGRESLQDGRLRTEPVTDILVRIRHALRTYRGVGQTQPREAERSYVEAQIMVVTGGRIGPPGLAQCTGFDGDVLVCTVECEGGSFGLRRGRQGGEHFLIVGAGSNDGGQERGIAPPERLGFRLGSCGARGAMPALMLLPRGGRLATEVRLLEQR